MSFTLKITVLLLASTLVLVACGGGGGSTESGTPPSAGTHAGATTLSGTAAAGAPVSGSVTLIDSHGIRRTQPTGADGSYVLDTAGLTPPFLLRASGTAAGSTVVLHSAATADDLGHTVNITPLTELIVANTVGGPVAALFDAPGADLSAISTAALNAARDTLSSRLRPVLDGMQVAPGFDLLRSGFKADHSGFDGALDLLQVSIDPDGSEAVITNRATGHSITDALRNTTDTDALPAVDRATLKAAASDLAAIGAVIARFNAAFEYGPPSGSALAPFLALFDTDFRHSGMTRSAALSSQYFLWPYGFGWRYTHPVLVSRSADGNTVRARFTLVIPEAGIENHAAELSFRKTPDGTWLIQGDRQPGDVTPYILSQRTINADGSYSYERYVEFWISSSPSFGATRAILQGPGLPTIATDIDGLERVEGILLQRSSSEFNTDMFAPLGAPGEEQTVHLPLCADLRAAAEPCLDESRMKTHGVYTVTFVDGSKQIVGAPARLSLVSPPLSRMQMTATPEKWFATITSLSPDNTAALGTAGDVAATWTLPTTAGLKMSYLTLDAPGIHESADLKPADTRWSLGHGLPFPPETPPQIAIAVTASGGREFVTSRIYR